ncbi:MAG: GNAT family N-acetyltransferase [Planctomycetota bacterium]
MTPLFFIRPADRRDLPGLYALAVSAFSFDSFSVDLLAEKLFRVPRPDQEEYRVYLAELEGTPVGMMQTIWRAAETKGWLGLFAVSPGQRRRRIAATLLQQVKQDWRGAGVSRVEVLAIPGNYFTPGLDPRYTEAVCFLEQSGFERFKDGVNLTARLDRPFETGAEERRLVEIGVEVRRARHGDVPLLDIFFGEHFGPDWRLEAELAMANDPPALHLGLREGRVVAFSAHSTQNREWGFFGPMGTAPPARGLGIGRVLLWRCLNDLRHAGHRTAVIPWVGPIAFYSHHAGCRVSRVFWRYQTAPGFLDPIDKNKP